VDCVPLIAASIMSKKIAEGIDGLVLDVKAGSGAFMKTEADARRLAEPLIAIGKAFGVSTRAVITMHNWPLGRAVGNANEVSECLDVLKGRGPADLIELSLDLSARMLVVAGAAPTRPVARALCQKAIDSGAALEKFRSMVLRQGGDPRVVDDCRRLPAAPERHVLTADHAGFVTSLDAGLIGRAAAVLGAGRDRLDDVIDPGVGIMLGATVGDAVSRGDVIVELHYRDQARLHSALPLVMSATQISEQPPPARHAVIIGELSS
jgi:thymidine phosphorylase